MDVYIENNLEEIDQKSDKNRCPYLVSLSDSLNTDYFAGYFLKDIFAEKFFTRTCFCDLVANPRKCLFQKIKLRQKHCQNKVKQHLMDGQINLLISNHKNILCEIKFLICIHKIRSVKVAISETQFTKVSSLTILSHENIFSLRYY